MNNVTKLSTIYLNITHSPQISAVCELHFIFELFLALIISSSSSAWLIIISLFHFYIWTILYYVGSVRRRKCTLTGSVKLNINRTVMFFPPRCRQHVCHQAALTNTLNTLTSENVRMFRCLLILICIVYALRLHYMRCLSGQNTKEMPGLWWTLLSSCVAFKYVQLRVAWWQHYVPQRCSSSTFACSGNFLSSTPLFEVNEHK